MLIRLSVRLCVCCSFACLLVRVCVLVCLFGCMFVCLFGDPRVLPDIQGGGGPWDSNHDEKLADIFPDNESLGKHPVRRGTHPVQTRQGCLPLRIGQLIY